MSTDWKMEDVMNVTRFSYTALYRIRKRAISRGFNPSICQKVTAFYVKDVPRSGRPGITIAKQQEVLDKVNSD